MKLETGKHIDASGTYLQDYIDVSYKELVKVFGKSIKDDGYKTDAQWTGTIDGEIFTIYNYKDGKNYLEREGTPKTKITEWHIGGHTKEIVYRVKAYFYEMIRKQK